MMNCSHIPEKFIRKLAILQFVHHHHLVSTTTVERVFIEGRMTGFKPNTVHGFHIHQWGNLSSMNEHGFPDCKSAGAHYNPFQRNHGSPWSGDRHVGDLGNVEADANGVATVEMTDSLVKLFGSQSVIGRALVVGCRCFRHDNKLNFSLLPFTFFFFFFFFFSLFSFSPLSQVHADEDDLGKGGHSDSLTTGHAGARLACCVIGNVN
jgi:Cu-Zn family superoxide dismutase